VRGPPRQDLPRPRRSSPLVARHGVGLVEPAFAASGPDREIRWLRRKLVSHAPTTQPTTSSERPRFCARGQAGGNARRTAKPTTYLGASDNDGLPGESGPLSGAGPAASQRSTPAGRMLNRDDPYDHCR